ncbi:murein hydrolase activator EnvC family protein [Acidimangrovimonas pyrenivorans]|uniref:Murein hydrolase activator EnvC family protein n=1 Tax=Acidimangrovimonas pyrenivorans TaxID=2030798 RepID=A0ABV7AJ39_9RHOB
MRPRRRALLAPLLALSVLLGPVPLRAATDAPAAVEPGDAGKQAAAAAAGLREAITALDAARGAKDRVAALTRTIQSYETGLAALRAGLRRVTIREAALTRSFGAKRDEISRLLGVLTTMERTPAPLLLLHPAGPLGTVRSAMILQQVTPELQDEAEALRGKLQELAHLRKIQQQSVGTLRQGLRAVQQARTALSEAVSNRTDLPRKFTTTPTELKHLTDNVTTLAQFADILSDREFQPGDGIRTFTSAKGILPLPVEGTILRHAGEADAAGIRRPGIVIATRPRALVTAPWPATIRYRGPLLDYGNVIVLEPGDGYLLVLAGLDVVYGQVGQVIAAGDPVGLMGGKEADAAEFVAATQDRGGAGRSETLYLELRKGSKPVDPEQWFAKTQE